MSKLLSQCARNVTLKCKFGVSICAAVNVACPAKKKADKDYHLRSLLSEVRKKRLDDFDGAKHVRVELGHKSFVSTAISLYLGGNRMDFYSR